MGLKRPKYRQRLLEHIVSVEGERLAIVDVVSEDKMAADDVIVYYSTRIDTKRLSSSVLLLWRIAARPL